MDCKNYVGMPQTKEHVAVERKRAVKYISKLREHKRVILYRIAKTQKLSLALTCIDQ